MKGFKQFVVETPDIKTVTGPVRSAQSRMGTINRWLSNLGRSYYPTIPIEKIFNICHDNGYQAIQEDGTPWEGLLLGRDGRANIELRDLQGNKNRHLSLSYHKMDVTGNWEVTAYVS